MISGSKHANYERLKAPRKPLPIDLSITSAYEPATSPLDSLPSPSVLNFQRSTSQKPASRPHLYAPQPPPQLNRAPSASAYSMGRRPVPAPRTSVGSRSDIDYQAIDMFMREEDMATADQLSSSAGFYDLQTTNSHSTAFKRSLTLPISGSSRSAGALSGNTTGNERPQTASQVLPYSTNEPYAKSSSKSSTLEYYASSQHSSSSRRSSNRSHTTSSSSSSIRRKFLVGEAKNERRKSDLLQTSPYPQLASLAAAASNTVTSTPSNAAISTSTTATSIVDTSTTATSTVDTSTTTTRTTATSTTATSTIATSNECDNINSSLNNNVPSLGQLEPVYSSLVKTNPLSQSNAYSGDTELKPYHALCGPPSNHSVVTASLDEFTLIPPPPPPLSDSNSQSPIYELADDIDALLPYPYIIRALSSSDINHLTNTTGIQPRS